MSRFIVELEYPPPRPVTATLSHLLRKALRDRIQLIDPLEDGGFVIRINCEADDTEQAITAVCELVRATIAHASPDIARHRVVGIHATPIDHWDKFPALMGIAEIAVLYKVSRQRASSMARSRSFPKPLQNLKMGPVFSRRAVLRHMRQHHVGTSNRDQKVGDK